MAHSGCVYQATVYVHSQAGRTWFWLWFFTNMASLCTHTFLHFNCKASEDTLTLLCVVPRISCTVQCAFQCLCPRLFFGSLSRRPHRLCQQYLIFVSSLPVFFSNCLFFSNQVWGSCGGTWVRPWQISEETNSPCQWQPQIFPLWTFMTRCNTVKSLKSHTVQVPSAKFKTMFLWNNTHQMSLTIPSPSRWANSFVIGNKATNVFDAQAIPEDWCPSHPLPPKETRQWVTWLNQLCPLQWSSLQTWTVHISPHTRPPPTRKTRDLTPKAKANRTTSPPQLP